MLRTIARFLTGWVGLVVMFLAPFVLGLAVWKWVNQEGGPGALFALIIMLPIPTMALVHILREGSSSPRSRRMRAASKDLDLNFVDHLHLPHSFLDLPAFGGVGARSAFDGITIGGYSNLLSGRREGSEIMIFDYSTETESSPYSKPKWHTCVATVLELDCPKVIVQPRATLHPHDATGLHDVGLGSPSFDDRFRLMTTDPRFAMGLVDQRMMAWLLDDDEPWTFEIAGTWAAIISSQIPTRRLDEAITALFLFRAHIPRVMSSLYPPAGPDLV